MEEIASPSCILCCLLFRVEIIPSAQGFEGQMG
uniref:Uncharacterized protein n=1 Tax=Rhizophora mucronata TaxID=61149 RepID=A0A2P2QAA1_RHIMU